MVFDFFSFSFLARKKSISIFAPAFGAKGWLRGKKETGFRPGKPGKGKRGRSGKNYPGFFGMDGMKY